MSFHLFFFFTVHQILAFLLNSVTGSKSVTCADNSFFSSFPCLFVCLFCLFTCVLRFAFGTHRVPGKGQDSLRNTSDPQHVVIMWWVHNTGTDRMHSYLTQWLFHHLSSLVFLAKKSIIGCRGVHWISHTVSNLQGTGKKNETSFDAVSVSSFRVLCTLQMSLARCLEACAAGRLHPFFMYLILMSSQQWPVLQS